MVKVEAKNLLCQKGDKILFRKLNFSLGSGELMLVQGHNGAGKTSLLRIIAGLATPEKGDVRWQNERSQSLVEAMSYLGHKDGLKRALTPLENIFYLVALGERKITPQQLAEVMEILEIRHFIDRPCYQLSMGERRRAALAAIILQNKPFWILDEPFAALDVNCTRVVEGIFNAHINNGGMIMMASHVALEQPSRVLNLADWQ